MIVMGGIVGAGIFINPYVVAQQVHTPLLILGAWIIGGIVAMLGAFVYAELAARTTRSRRPVCLPARGVSSRSRLSLRMGAAAGDSDRRHGGGHGDLRALFAGTDRLGRCPNV